MIGKTVRMFDVETYYRESDGAADAEKAVDGLHFSLLSIIVWYFSKRRISWYKVWHHDYGINSMTTTAV